MANRIDTVLTGIADPALVVGAIGEACENGIAAGIVDRWAAAIQNAVLPNGLLDRRFLAIVCSYLNKEVMATGRIYQCTADGKLTHQYVTSEDERATFLSLMAGE